MTKKVLVILIFSLALVLIPSAAALADSGNTPSAPSGLTGTVTSGGGVVLNWIDNSSIEDGFMVFRKLDTDADWPASPLYTTGADVTTYLDSIAVRGKNYYYKVVAVNIATSGWPAIPLPYYSPDPPLVYISVPLITIIPQPPIITLPVPAAPTNLSLPIGYVVEPDSVILKWTDNSSNEEGFLIERRLAGGTWAQVGEVVAAVNTYVDEEVKPATAYEYRVSAYNLLGLLKRYSDYSNVLAVTTPALEEDEIPPTTPGTYPGASSWAVAEIDLAVQAGLTIPDILSNFQNSITREEFCEVAVKLYEALSGKTAQPINPNPFTDTSNSEILKAYNLGIVKGTAADKFSPNKNITRQEICVMLLRALKAVEPGADYSATGVAAFPDESLISDWAIDAVRYMSKAGIIKGVGAGKIDPLGNTTREHAILLVYRTYADNI